MALAYLLDPCLQHQNRAGVNNVNGYFEVFEYDTDDRATVYTDFAGTLAPAHIGIDNNGRAVMIVDSDIAYRVEMHAPNGDLIYAQAPVWTVASGGGVGALVKVVSTDGTVDVQKTTVGSVTTYDLSVEGENEPSTWGSKTCSASAINVTGDWVEVPYASSEGSIRYNNGWRATKNCAVDIAASLEMDSGDADALNNFDVKCEFFKNGTSVLVENGQLDPSKSIDRVCFEYKGAVNASDVIDAKIYVRSAESLTVDLVGRAFYNEECDGLIGGGGGGGSIYNSGDGTIVHNTGNHEIDIDWTKVQPKLTAGDNITISGNVISATGGGSTYTGGTGIVVDNVEHTISLDGDVVIDANYVHTDNNFTTIYKNKLDGIQDGAEQNVQSDWNVSDTSSDAFIRNKPDLSQYATQSDLDDKQDKLTAGDNITITNNVISAADQIQSDWNQTSVSAKDYIKNKPTIPSGNQLLPPATAADEDKVLTIDDNGDPQWETPTAFTQQQADWNQTNTQAVDYIKNKPNITFYDTKELVAGTNITLTEVNNVVTVDTVLPGVTVGYISL